MVQKGRPLRHGAPIFEPSMRSMKQNMLCWISGDLLHVGRISNHGIAGAMLKWFLTVDLDSNNTLP
jgi:hypothetical protein